MEIATQPDCIYCGEPCRDDDPLWLYHRDDLSRPTHWDCAMAEQDND